MITNQASAEPRKYILILETNGEYAEEIVLRLAALGYGVKAVTSEAEALRAIAAFRYDAVFLTTALAAVDFTSLIEAIREESPGTRILLIEPRDNLFDWKLTAAHRHEADSVWIRGSTPETLADTVTAVLRESFEVQSAFG